MDPVDEEVVALYDDGGRPRGSAPRSAMRAQNLRHAATGVIVRDSFGRVYVHRRTPTKDVYPSRWDFAAGGVVLDGEDPVEAARRELAEELGVTSEIASLGEGDYSDEHTSYHAFRFVTTWDGPITPQPEEVSYGAWLSIERLLDRIADPEILFMPDSVTLFGGWLQERAAERTEPEQGWDSHAAVVEGRWLDRVPRFPDAESQLRTETRLMPRLAPLLPLPVPVPIVLDDAPLRVRHVLLPGHPALDPAALTADQGRRLGEFLRRLHDMPVTIYVETGVPDGVAARAELLATLERMLHRVTPLLPEGIRETGRALLRRVALPAPGTLVHGDLAAHHLLVEDGAVSGVIDWSDCRVGDPAVDLGWALFGTPDPFAEAVATTYGVTDDELVRALDWYRLTPWYDVLWGLGPGGRTFVDDGVEQLAARLDIR
jgi:aminoglycoside phosphotransferase (APT) family kinase protein/ADP-ribose pyrophosphatase YjhB (NUDIX family)